MSLCYGERFAEFGDVKQILKDGMQHMGKLICSNLGAQMDSEPKRWRILGIVVIVVVLYTILCVYRLYMA